MPRGVGTNPKCVRVFLVFAIELPEERHQALQEGSSRKSEGREKRHNQQSEKHSEDNQEKNLVDHNQLQAFCPLSLSGVAEGVWAQGACPRLRNSTSQPPAW